jgi:nucleotide-binding universal stress UspA family protein
MRFSTDQQSIPPSETVLVLTDGSDRAKRVAEWGLVFVGAPGTTVHRIEVLECLDSGVVIQTDTGGLDKRERLGQRPPSASPAQTANRHLRDESTIDVLHGVPYEALLDYVATTSIDCIIMSTHERTSPDRSFLGRTFAHVHRAAPVPVITTNRTATPDTPRCELAHAARKQKCVSEPG